jgi:pyrrolidone-carboxylate peptidase
MLVMVYGFGPYRQFENNITQQIVRKLPSSPNLQKIVFPVRFDKKQFTDAVKKHRPDFVLGLGQSSRGRLLRIERRAVNKRRDDKKQKLRPIVRGGPKWLQTHLRQEKSALGRQAKLSSDAGDYVCNFSMYVILDYLRRHTGGIAQFGFVHIPHRYDPKKATRFVRKVLNQLRMGDHAPR